MGDPSLLAKGGKFPPTPVPIKVGQTFMLDGTSYFVMGRVMYRGWDEEDTSDYWIWNEWLLGAQDGRMLWLAYDTEDGFVLYNKMRFRPTEEFKPQVSMYIPLADRKIPVGERYPANIVGAEGELTWQAKRGERLTMLEGNVGDKHYSMQVTANELELHEGTTIPETSVATALNNPLWLEQIRQRNEGKKTRDYIGVVCLIFAAIALIAAVALSGQGENIANQTLTVDPTNPVSSFPVEFDVAGRPATVKARMETPLSPNTFIDVDVSIIAPNESETVIFDQEFYHETGSDDEGPWTETSMEVSDMFVPALTGTHRIELALAAGTNDAGQTVSQLNQSLSVRVEVWKNQFVGTWLFGYGAVIGIVGLLLMLSGGGIKTSTLLIIAAPIVILLILMALGVNLGDLVSGLFDILSEA
jgi:hypothetical protein